MGKRRHLFCPPLDTPILDWWAGCYDHVFVVFNPFFRVPGYTPETAAFGPIRVGPTTAQGVIEFLSGAWIERPNEAPDDFENLIKSSGHPVSWKTVGEAIGADDAVTFSGPFGSGPWPWSVGTETRKSQKGSPTIAAYCIRTGTDPPEEDQSPVILEPILGRFLRAVGLTEVDLWSEWRDVSQTSPVSTFRSSDPVQHIPQQKVSAVAAPGFLIAWEYDDVAGLLCLSNEMRLRANPADFFEGFPVTRDMFSDVFNPLDRQHRKPPSSLN